MNLRRIAGLLAASGIVVALAAGSASADPVNGGGSGGSGSTAGCSGESCYVSLLRLINLSPSGGAGVAQGDGTANNVDLSLPICWEQPWKDAADTYNWWIHQSEDTLGPGGEALLQYEQQIDQEYKDKAAGMWWAPEDNGTMAAFNSSYCQSLPLLEWVPAGGEPPDIAADVPPKVLAEYAYSKMILPKPAITLNPAAGKATYVNLPTFVTATVPAHPTITATLGGEAVTVTATAAGLQLTLAAGAPTAAIYPSSGLCGPEGSTESAQEMSSAGVGTTPDCGFVFDAPSTAAFAVNASETWTVVSSEGTPLGPPDPTLSTANVAGVDEVQSTNGG